jgi:selenocysteine lyase/cysteine desulfurase
LGAALDLLKDIGIDSIQKSVLSHGAYLVEGLQKRNIKILNSMVPMERSGIVSCLLRVDPKKFASYMAEKNVSLTVRDGIVRLSPHYYNSRDEADQFFELLDDF